MSGRGARQGCENNAPGEVGSPQPWSREKLVREGTLGGGGGRPHGSGLVA